MIQVATLYSGSSGNSTYIAGDSFSLLVDIGKSCKQTELQLQNCATDPDQVGAILLTHEHIDHVRGLRVFLKKHPVPVYASVATACALRAKGLVEEGTDIRYIDEDHPAAVGGFQVQAMPTSHDCDGSLCFIIQSECGKKVTVATDMGRLPAGFMKEVGTSDLVVLESNYDEAMLRTCAYPYYLKRRIASETGHLANTACAETVQALTNRGVPRFLLAHLSINSNLPQLAYQASAMALGEIGASLQQDVLLEVAPRDNPSPLWAF